MSRAGATRDYRSGQKNHWRRTVWNEVLRRTDGREKHEFVLYLAGPQDNDRAIAIEKGVPGRNLIAIDDCAANVAAVRAGRGSAVVGDVIDVLWSWPDDKPVCAVMLDFCCGLDFNVAGVYDVFERRPLRKAHMMVNFMRGRDAYTNSWREIATQAGLLEPLWRASLDNDSDPVCVMSDVKHRAYQFAVFNAYDTWLACMGKGSAGAWRESRERGARAEAIWFDEGDPRRLALKVAVGQLVMAMRPSFFSYRSGPLVFDSAVMRHACYGLNDGPWEQEIAARVAAFEERPLVRKLAAMFAVRTMRAASA